MRRVSTTVSRKASARAQLEEKAAVACGYWHTFRFNPELSKEGKNPFVLDSKEPTASYQDFIRNETRYSALQIAFPDRANVLFGEAEVQAKEKYNKLKKLAEQ